MSENLMARVRRTAAEVEQGHAAQAKRVAEHVRALADLERQCEPLAPARAVGRGPGRPPLSAAADGTGAGAGTGAAKPHRTRKSRGRATQSLAR